MYIILNYSRAYFINSWWKLASLVKSLFFSIFPFLKYSHDSEYKGNDFENRGDYLFVPEIFSTKKYLYPETISFGIVLVVLFSIFVLFLTIIFSTSAIVVISGLVALLYFILMLFKLWIVYNAFSYKLVDFTKEEIDAIDDEKLPIYTVLVPLRDEAEVIDQIIESMSSLDYPKDKINMVVPLEGYDRATIDAIKRAEYPPHFKAYILPYVEPQTKPKTMNVIFGQAKGEFLVIYDAEIMPDADQMKKAYLAFKKYPDIACFQTRLEHYNTDQNILTKLFNMEFSFYYDYFLPGLQKLGFPIPLSGHSTHFRLKALQDIGAWDSYNVAEDCDVGIRLYRHGYRTGIINSMSREEAAGDLWGWIKQRTRWMKGFIQTSIVHLRYPLRFKNEVGGWKNFFAFLLTVPGTVLVNFLNLITWVILATWIITKAPLIQGWYPQPILYMSVAAFIIGGFIFTYLNLIGSYGRGKFYLVKYGLLTPVYWLLLAFATMRAVVQTITNPYTWEKTKHGTHLSEKTPT